MKATLEFDLSPGSNDQYDYESALKGVQSRMLIDDLRQFVRGKLKYSELESGEAVLLLEEIKTMLWEIRYEGD